VPYGIFIALALFAASPLLPYLFGASFRGSVEAMRWLCILPLIRGLHYAWGTTITGSASQWYRTGAQAGAAVVNLLLNFVLIPRWSWRGAAAASLLTDGALAAATWMIVQYLRVKKEASQPATVTHAA
jgi:O-antigen/teichoic acid export membrane protein